jgi:hypothetical protein
MSENFSRLRALAAAGRLEPAAAFSSAAALATRHRRVGAGLVAALVSVAALLALVPGLGGSASPRTLYAGGDAARATSDFHDRFGEEPILVLVRGSKRKGGLPALLLTEDLSRMLGLEGCLSGNLPPKAKPPAPACGELARTKPIQVVYGPGTFINESARQVAARFNALRARGRREAEQVARAARKVAAAQGKSAAEQERLASQARELSLAQSLTDAQGLALRFGLSRIPQLNDPDFVTKLVFEPSLGFDTPKPRFAYLFPTNQTALIQARLRPGLSDSEQRRAIALVREATASKPFRLERGTYGIAGAPVVEQGVAHGIPSKIWPPLVASILLLLAVVALAGRSRPPAAALIPALAAATVPYGLLALLGASLTLASLAVFPVVAGLGTTLVLLLRWSFGDLERRAALAAAVSAVTVAGALSLLVSPVSIVRAFGALVALGLLLAIAFTFALASWVLPQTPAPAASSRRLGAGPIARATTRLGGIGSACLRTAVGRPGRVLGGALLVALAGWVLSTRTDVQPTLERLAPAGTAAIEDAAAVRSETDFGGDVDVVVRSRELNSPRVLKWMSGYQRRVLAKNGYREDRRCQEADLCPALSLIGLVGTVRSERQARVDLERLPRYFSRAVIAPDRQTANLAFRLRAMSPTRSEDVIEEMRAQLDPPPGTSAELAALPPLLADTSSGLRTSWLALAAVLLSSVLLFLIPRGRRREQTFAPLIPALLATGWSGLVLYLLPIPLNQLTASLAAFTVALTLSFGLIVSAAYRVRRSEGGAALAAFERSYGDNAGVLALAGTAAISGFVALLASDVPMLRDLGVAAAVDLVVVLVASALVLPAALVWAEERRPIALPRSRVEAIAIARAAAARARAGFSSAARFGRARARRALARVASLRGARRRRRRPAADGGEEPRPPSIEP